MAETISIPFFVEPVEGNGYRATALDCHAEAQTADEAEERLREQVAERLRFGGKLEMLQFTSTSLLPSSDEPPYMKFAGDMKDDPLFDEWVEAMQENRRRVEDDPDYL